MKIAILGAGLIGERRGAQVGEHTLAGIYDLHTERAKMLCSKLNVPRFESPEEMFASDVEIVIVATYNSSLQPLALEALASGKHVLLEKPAGLSVEQIDELCRVSKECGRAVKVGYNLRFHPGIQKLCTLASSGALGDLMFLRARYGHGGRLGMEGEWRMQPELSGGGELLDQGVHILDLIYFLFGPLPLHSSFVTTSYWASSVDDNAVLTLAQGKQWATFHVSCSEWKNTFSLELTGRKGKVTLDGLSGSYGPETLKYYQMSPQMGPPEVFIEEFTGPDQSWLRDLENLIQHIQRGIPLQGDLESARYALEQVGVAYQQNGYLHLPAARAAF